MKTLVWKDQNLEVIETIKPTIGREKSESLIKVLYAGICNTDIEITKGYMDFNGTLGHEFVGIVEVSDDKALIGKRVVSDINCPCHHCSDCQKKNYHHCMNRQVIGIKDKEGAFAQYMVAPTENLVVVPSRVNDQDAVFAEPIAAALQINEQLKLSKNEPVCVIGDGKLGLLIGAIYSELGFQVTLVGHHLERKQRLGLEFEYLDKLPGRQYPVVVEVTGNPQGLSKAIEMTAPLGTLVLKSTYVSDVKLNPSLMVINEISIVGSRCGPIDKAIDFLSHHKFSPSCLTDQIMPIAEGVKAMQEAAKKGTLKILLEM